MTVSSQTNNVTFLGNGATTVFPLPFRFFANGDVFAYFIDSTTGASTPMVLGVDYTLAGAGEPEVNGNAVSVLTTTAPLATGRGLYVERVMQEVQNTDIVNQGEFFASTHEDVFDRLTMLIQQANANSQGAIRVAIGDPDPQRLAPAAQRANLLLGFDAAGQPITVAPISGSSADLAMRLANDTDPLLGAALVGYSGRTVSDRLNDAKNVKDFGAVGDGITDDTAAIQAAINATPAHAELDLCGGTYLLSKGPAHAGYPNGDQPCLVIYQKPGLVFKNGTLLVQTHGLGAIDVKLSPGAKIRDIVMVGYGNFPPLDGITGRAEKGTSTEGYYFLTFDQNGYPRNNSVNTTAFTTGGYGGAFPQFGGGTAATWGAWGGGYIQNIGHGVYIDNSDDCLITGCDISGFNGAAVHPKDSAGVSITGNCYLHDNYVAGVEIDSSNTRTDCSINVSGNRINNNGHPGALITHLNLDPGYGVATNNGATPFAAVSVKDNFIVGNKRKGVDSHSVIDYTVIGNTITDTGAGIHLYAGHDSKMVSAVVVGNQIKRIANSKGSNTLGISVSGQDSTSTASIVISGNNIEEIGVTPSIVDIGVSLSSWAIHASNSNVIAVSGNVVKNITYIAQVGIVVPQSDSQPVFDAAISSNVVKGKFVTGFLGATGANTLARPLIAANRISIQSCAPYTNAPIGITAVDAMLGLNSINLPDVAGAKLTAGTKSTGMTLKVTVIITAGVVTFAVDSNFELFGKTPITSVASTAAGVRISFAGWLPTPRNVQITRKQAIIKQLGTNALINCIYEHDLQPTFLDVGLAIQDYAAKTSANVAANNADGVIAVYITF